MCGIAGGGGPAEVAAMLDAMGHRGPDGRGALEWPGGAAGMVRLALVNLSERGGQPFWSADRRVALLWNGEMYNFRAEKARLAAAGVSFRSATDTEVVLALYLERGLGFVERLRGMFALAVFDWRDGGAAPTVILARDPMGIKPLLVADRDGLVFASEMKGILASGRVASRVDGAALADYLARGFVLQPRTLVDGVRMLAPGTLEVHAPGEAPRVTRYWSLPPARPRVESLGDAAARLRGVLEESVALHAFADAPVGAFLSGGVDSAGIVALMRPHLPRLRTYTLRFPELPGQDEADDAAATARALGCEHTTVDVTSSEVRAALPRFAAALDQPSVDGLNVWLVARAAARDVKGVLSGLGGDEWFAGYPVTGRMARAGLATRLAGRLASRLPLAHARVRNLAARRSPEAMWFHTHRAFSDEDARRLCGHAPSPPPEIDEGPVGTSCVLDVGLYLGSQLLRDSDATSMGHSLELRTPFVDPEVAAFARACADEHKLAGRAKRVLVEALRDVLPAGILARPKRGFALPLETWLRGPLAAEADAACAPDNLARLGLDPAAFPEANPYPQRWAILVLHLWHEHVLAAARGARRQAA